MSVVALAIVLIAGQLTYLHQRFGNVGYSSFVGENLKRIAVTTLPEHQLHELERAGKVSDLASVKPFSPYSSSAHALPPCHVASSDPALAAPRKSDGEVNLNFLCFRPAHRAALDDSFAAMRAYPGNYLTAVGRSTLLFSSWPVAFDEPRARSYHWLVSAYRPMLLPVHVSYDIGGADPQGLALIFRSGLGRLPLLLTMAIGLLLVLWKGAAASWHIVRGRITDRRLMLAWIGFTVVSVCAVGILFDFYENARFRECLDPIVLGMLIVSVSEVLRRSFGRRLGAFSR